MSFLVDSSCESIFDSKSKKNKSFFSESPYVDLKILGEHFDVYFEDAPGAEDRLTILRAIDGLTGKCVQYDGEKWNVESPEEDLVPTQFAVAEVQLHTFEDIENLLTLISNNLQICLIRGRLKQQGDWSSLTYYRRRIDSNLGRGRFVDHPRNIVCLDWDGLPMPDLEGLHNVPSMIEACAFAMPEPFRGSSFVYQLSASAHTKLDTVNFHSFHFLDQAVASDDLNALLQLPKFVQIDESAVRPVQQIFTTNPTVIDEQGNQMSDPLAGWRIGFFDGEFDEVKIGQVLSDSKDYLSQERERKRSIRDGEVCHRLDDPERVANMLNWGWTPDVERERLLSTGRKYCGEHFYNPIYQVLSRARHLEMPNIREVRDLIRAIIIQVAKEKGKYNEYEKKFRKYLSDEDLYNRLNDIVVEADT